MINEDVIENISEINGWTPDTQCHSGSLFWSKEGVDTIIFATPNWEEDGALPIELANENGEYSTFATVRLTGSLENQLVTYKTMVELAIISLND